MKTLSVLAALTLACVAIAPASAIEVVSANPAVQAHPDLAPLAGRTVAQYALLPELPEPEVLAMMLLGLVLIGYRASRESDETFK